MTSLENQVALITGAGDGTGQEIPLGLAAEDAQMGLLARTPSDRQF